MRTKVNTIVATLSSKNLENIKILFSKKKKNLVSKYLELRTKVYE
jgi:hypothetical protein